MSFQLPDDIIIKVIRCLTFPTVARCVRQANYAPKPKETIALIHNFYNFCIFRPFRLHLVNCELYDSLAWLAIDSFDLDEVPYEYRPKALSLISERACDLTGLRTLKCDFSACHFPETDRFKGSNLVWLIQNLPRPLHHLSLNLSDTHGLHFHNIAASLDTSSLKSISLGTSSSLLFSIACNKNRSFTSLKHLKCRMGEMNFDLVARTTGQLLSIDCIVDDITTSHQGILSGTKTVRDLCLPLSRAIKANPHLRSVNFEAETRVGSSLPFLLRSVKPSWRGHASSLQEFREILLAFEALFLPFTKVFFCGRSLFLSTARILHNIVESECAVNLVFGMSYSHLDETGQVNALLADLATLQHRIYSLRTLTSCVCLLTKFHGSLTCDRRLSKVWIPIHLGMMYHARKLEIEAQVHWKSIETILNDPELRDFLRRPGPTKVPVPFWSYALGNAELSKDPEIFHDLILQHSVWELADRQTASVVLEHPNFDPISTIDLIRFACALPFVVALEVVNHAEARPAGTLTCLLAVLEAVIPDITQSDLQSFHDMVKEFKANRKADAWILRPNLTGVHVAVQRAYFCAFPTEVEYIDLVKWHASTEGKLGCLAAIRRRIKRSVALQEFDSRLWISFSKQVDNSNSYIIMQSMQKISPPRALAPHPFKRRRARIATSYP